MVHAHGFAGGFLLSRMVLPTPSDPAVAGPPEGELPEGQERPPWGAPSTQTVEGEAWVRLMPYNFAKK